MKYALILMLFTMSDHVFAWDTIAEMGMGNVATNFANQVSTPYKFDKAHAIEDGRADLGGDIMIHGGRAGSRILKNRH